MTHTLRNQNRSLALMFLLILASNPAWGDGTSPASFEIDLNELKKTAEPGKKAPVRKPKPVAAEPARQGSAGAATYTVRPGDNLFRILMRDFGMSNREAELLIPEIVRINGLPSSTTLSTGKKLTIPLERRQATHHRARKAAKPAPVAEQPKETAAEAPADREAKQVQTAVRESAEEKVVAAPTETSQQDVTAPQAAQNTRASVEPTAHQSDQTSPFSVKPVPGASPDDIADGLLTAMMLAWEPDKVISGESTATGNSSAFSIKVDRCLTYKGKRYVITVNSIDPFTYTMLRLVEAADYKVIHLDGKSNFIELASTLLSQLGIPFTPGRYKFTPQVAGSGSQREIDGIMVAFTDRPTRIFLTNTPLDPVTAETLASSTAEKL